MAPSVLVRRPLVVGVALGIVLGGIALWALRPQGHGPTGPLARAAIAASGPAALVPQRPADARPPAGIVVLPPGASTAAIAAAVAAASHPTDPQVQRWEQQVRADAFRLAEGSTTAAWTLIAQIDDPAYRSAVAARWRGYALAIRQARQQGYADPDAQLAAGGTTAVSPDQQAQRDRLLLRLLQWDTDQDGCLDASEWQPLAAPMAQALAGPTASQWYAVYASALPLCDLDGDLLLDASEWRAALSLRRLAQYPPTRDTIRWTDYFPAAAQPAIATRPTPPPE
jgi:hypothetical protein